MSRRRWMNAGVHGKGHLRPAAFAIRLRPAQVEMDQLPMGWSLDPAKSSCRMHYAISQVLCAFQTFFAGRPKNGTIRQSGTRNHLKLESPFESLISHLSRPDSAKGWVNHRSSRAFESSDPRATCFPLRQRVRWPVNAWQRHPQRPFFRRLTPFNHGLQQTQRTKHGPSVSVDWCFATNSGSIGSPPPWPGALWAVYPAAVLRYYEPSQQNKWRKCIDGNVAYPIHKPAIWRRDLPPMVILGDGLCPQYPSRSDPSPDPCKSQIFIDCWVAGTHRKRKLKLWMSILPRHRMTSTSC